MKLTISHESKKEIYDLNETASVYLNITDADWLKIYKIGDEIRVCFESPIPNKLPESPHILKNASFVNGKITACCPFHEEKTPSFFIDLHREIYRCLSCGAKGNTCDL